MLEKLTCSEIIEVDSSKPVEDQYFGMMTCFYFDIFESHVIKRAENWRSFELNELSAFKQLLEVFRPRASDDGELKILN